MQRSVVGSNFIHTRSVTYGKLHVVVVTDGGVTQALLCLTQIVAQLS